jgi:hypothetical protein
MGGMGNFDCEAAVLLPAQAPALSPSLPLSPPTIAGTAAAASGTAASAPLKAPRGLRGLLRMVSSAFDRAAAQ